MIWQHQTDRVGSLCFKSNWQKQWHAQWKLCPLSPYFKRTLHKWVKNKVKKRRKAVTCHFYILLESYFATFTNKNFKAISLHLSLNIIIKSRLASNNMQKEGSYNEDTALKPNPIHLAQSLSEGKADNKLATEVT